MYMYIHIHTYIHTYMCIHTYTHTYIHTCTYIQCTYIHTDIHTHIHTYIHTHMYIHVHTHTYSGLNILNEVLGINLIFPPGTSPWSVSLPSGSPSGISTTIHTHTLPLESMDKNWNDNPLTACSKEVKWKWNEGMRRQTGRKTKTPVQACHQLSMWHRPLIR